ncbi:MAG: hypothetical protein AUI14_16310 [Actinobacteria bacterium 13_2_20CM_2_71_6]|nr:MAG: hypothetical protein AUI14_16310 [Actinobacteria bacterium 13_2_20CM_2_71_6]
MTFFYPDIASYQKGISLDGMVLVSVKATEGTTYVNPDYARVVRDAAKRQIPVISYHFLRHGNASAQAAHAFATVGPGMPLMLDVETADNGTKATIADVNEFISAYRSRDGLVSLIYLPRWYWQLIGSPDLRPLAAADIHMVSSNYTGYSDNGPGWAPYGGVAPLVWQYTDSHAVNGFSVDFNAVKVPLAEFIALIGGQMEQSDQVTGFESRGNTVGDVLADLSNFRDWWYLSPEDEPNNPPPPGSRAEVLLAAAQRMGQPAAVALTDAQVQALIDGLAAKLPPELSKADVETAVKDALRTGIGT